jgi:peptide/nickel transport system permease protein
MAGGQILIGEGPSAAHLLGTTSQGYDVLSRLLVGARPTVITGLLGGGIMISIGTFIGLVSGYVGGRVESVLMRFTDFIYALPFLPFAIVLVTFMRAGFLTSVVVIGLVLWRDPARVLRSQVLQIKERSYVMSAKATGASDARVIVKHILPNVFPMLFLFFGLGVGYSIILQASLAFVGVADPFVPSWGVMIRNAYESGLMGSAPWWSLSPAVMISATVASAIMIGRRYEALVTEEESEVVM